LKSSDELEFDMSDAARTCLSIVKSNHGGGKQSSGRGRGRGRSRKIVTGSVTPNQLVKDLSTQLKAKYTTFQCQFLNFIHAATVLLTRRVQINQFCHEFLLKSLQSVEPRASGHSENDESHEREVGQIYRE